MSDKRSNMEIHSFIVFDPTLTDNENEDEVKILYCHPKNIAIREQSMTIGLCEAMNNFSREFTDSPCQYIHTMKTRIVLQKLENNISIILTVNIPKRVERLATKAEDVKNKKLEHDEYLDEEIQNSICESIISHCRQMFFLFMGPPSLVIKNSGIECLKEKLDKFFTRYIGNGMLDGYQITDCLTGVQFLTVDKDLFSKVDSFISQFEEKFPVVCCSMLLFNNNLIHYTSNKEDLGILYRYLTTTLLAKYNVNETMNSTFTSTNMGRFVMVNRSSPLDLQIPILPKIFLGTNEYLRGNISLMRECNVLVYKALQATLVFFVEQNKIIDPEFSSSIDEYLGPEITVLAQNIIKKNGKISSSATDSPYKYLYWNPETLSVKCTLFPTRQLKSDFAPLVPQDTMRLMSDIRSEMEADARIKEMTVKLQSDSWVTGVRDCQKELLLAINKRNYSLVDVSKELKQTCIRDFVDVFKLDGE